MPNRYSVKSGLDERGMSGLTGISQIGERYRQNKQQEELGNNVSEALNAGDYDSLTKMMVQYPKLAPIMKNIAGFKSDETRRFYGEGLGESLTGMENMQTQDEAGETVYPELMVDELDMEGAPTGSKLMDAQFQDQMLDMDARLEKTAGRIEQAGGNPQHIREAQKLLQEGDMKGAYNQARTGMMMGNPDLYEERYGDTSDKDKPKTVQEWNFYNKLDAKTKQQYLDMKRQGYKVKTINGVDNLVPTNYVEGAGGEDSTPASEIMPLTTLGNEKDAVEQLASAKETGIQDIKSKWSQFNKLRDTEGGRVAGLKKAEYFYDKIASGEMNTGGMRKILSYIPFTFTEQGSMDEEFNAFAETSARQALKESGEIRPTDADVKGMKEAMFGIGRDEPVNLRLLDQFKDSIKRNDHKAYLAEKVTKFRKDNPKEKISDEDYESRKARLLGQ